MENFDLFDESEGGRPANLRLGNRHFEVQVLKCPKNEGTRMNSRRVEIVEPKAFGGRQERVLVAYVDDLDFRRPKKLVSGDYGWVVVMDYKEILREVERRMKEGKMDFPDAFDEYHRFLDENPSIHQKAARFSYMGRYYRAQHGEDASRLQSIIQKGEDYTDDPSMVRRLFEFVSHICPQGMEWKLSWINHKHTMDKLLRGRSFNETGYGRVVESAGWMWLPTKPRWSELLVPNEKAERLLSPVIGNRTIPIGPEWGDLGERLAGRT
jgi:hypothetical protein